MEQGFIVQNMETGEYVMHNGGESPVLEEGSYPYDYVKEKEKATIWNDFDHVCYVAVWYLDHFKKWRIIDTNSGKTFIRDKKRGSGKFEEETNE